jgi:threonine dehydrogenase-like Zn-dependent dehydrogenase
VGSAAHLWDEDVATAVDLLSRGKVNGRPLLTTHIALEQVVEGFNILEDQYTRRLVGGRAEDISYANHANS